MISTFAKEISKIITSGKWPIEKKRAFLAGSIAHVVIQTLYRLEHPGHYIVTERWMTLGDEKVNTITRYLKMANDGKEFLKLAEKLAANSKKGLPFSGTDFFNAIALVIDRATQNKDNPFSKRRFDILDFGPITPGNSLTIPDYPLAYEIKPLSELGKGSDYIKEGVKKLNEQFKTWGQTISLAYDVAKFLKMSATPGSIWPKTAYVIPIGPNLLFFMSVAPGVICYEWLRLSFKRLPLRELWELLRTAGDKVRERFSGGRTRYSDDVIVVGAAVGAMALVPAIGVAVVYIEAAVVTTGVALRELLKNNRMRTAAIDGISSILMAQASQTAQSSETNKESIVKLKSLEAMDAAYNNSGVLFDPALLSPEGRSGGTGPTKGEQIFEELVQAIANEFVSQLSVRVGQGSAKLDGEGIAAAREYVIDEFSPWLYKYLSSYGLDEFLELFGETKWDENSAKNIAVIISTFNEGIKPEDYVALMTKVTELNEENIEDSLPEGSKIYED